MASKYWIKLYHEILDDPKMGKLPDNLWRRAIELFLLAGDLDQNGELLDTEGIAWRLRQPAAQLELELFQLQQVGIIESNEQGWLVVKFAERQAPVSSTERSKYSRQKTKESATNRCTVSNVLPKMWAYPFYKSLPITPGIYHIFCSGSGLSYIGASRNLQQRIKQHLSEMASRIHKMSDDLYIYGPESLKVEILEETLDESELPKLETQWLLKYADTLYNVEKLGKNHRDRIATNRCTDIDIDIEQEESHLLKNISSGDSLTDIFNGQGQTSELTGDNPDDQWLEYRDKALKAFPGEWGRTAKERAIKKDQILGFVVETPGFDPAHWDFIIQDCITHGVSSNNIARFIEAYSYQDYEAYLADKYPKAGNGRDSPGVMHSKVTGQQVVRTSDGGYHV